MIAAGYSPSVRIFEAAACGTPLISDPWDGLDTVLRDGTEIVVAASPQDVVRCLAMPDDQRRAIAGAARARVLAEHTAEHRAAELEAYLLRAAERLPDREQARA
jgi:spore maturation protein CgeB